MNESIRPRGTSPEYIGLYLFTYMAIGVMTPLISQYLSYIGFSGSQIGIITASATCVGIFGSTFWGRIYANVNRRQLVVMGLCISAAAMAASNSVITSFTAFAIGYGVMYFFQVPIMPLTDALTVDDNRVFGKARMWGAIGFAIAILVAAKVAAIIGLGSIFFMYGLCFVISALFLFSIYMKKKKAGDIVDFIHPDTPRRRYRDLFANKKLWMLIACAFFMCGTNVANNTYFGFLYTQGGGTVVGIGLAFFLMAGSEAPFMAWTEKLDNKFTLQKMILFAMIISVLRFGWYSLGPSSELLLATFALQGFVNGIILVEFVRYVAKLVSDEYNGVAISAYYAIASSCSTIFCQFVGGIVLDIYGAQGVYAFFSLFNLIGLILYLIFGLWRATPVFETKMPKQNAG